MRNLAQMMEGRVQRVRAAIVLAATLLLFAAIVVSFRQAPDIEGAQVYAPVDAGGQAGGDALSVFRSERAGSRIAQMNALDELIAGSDEAAGAQAAQRKLLLVEHMEDETALEGVLSAMGFEDAVCTVSEGVCNVLVRAHTLTDAQTARILTAAREQTGLSAADVKVIPVGG